MGYDLIFRDGKWYVWSTVVDDFVGEADSPREVAQWFQERKEEDGKGLSDDARAGWIVEAERVRDAGESAIHIAGILRRKALGIEDTFELVTPDSNKNYLKVKNKFKTHAAWKKECRRRQIDEVI